jgi:hypothetical protein
MKEFILGERGGAKCTPLRWSSCDFVAAVVLNLRHYLAFPFWDKSLQLRPFLLENAIFS